MKKVVVFCRRKVPEGSTHQHVWTVGESVCYSGAFGVFEVIAKLYQYFAFTWVFVFVSVFVFHSTRRAKEVGEASLLRAREVLLNYYFKRSRLWFDFCFFSWLTEQATLMSC